MRSGFLGGGQRATTETRRHGERIDVSAVFPIQFHSSLCLSFAMSNEHSLRRRGAEDVDPLSVPPCLRGEVRPDQNGSFCVERFSNRVVRFMNASFTVPVGPLRCLAMITSAMLSGWKSGSLM